MSHYLPDDPASHTERTCMRCGCTEPDCEIDELASEELEAFEWICVSCEGELLLDEIEADVQEGAGSQAEDKL